MPVATRIENRVGTPNDDDRTGEDAGVDAGPDCGIDRGEFLGPEHARGGGSQQDVNIMFNVMLKYV